VSDSRLPHSAQRFSLFHEGFHILECADAMFTSPSAYREWLAGQFATSISMLS